MDSANKQKLDYIRYMDDLALPIGVKPSILLLFLKDPRLAWEVFFGPCTPYQYRLMGPGKWDGARNAILTQWDRTLKPFKTQCVLDSPKSASLSHYLKVWGVPVLLASLLLICKPSPFFKSVRGRISPYLISIWWGWVWLWQHRVILILSPNILCFLPLLSIITAVIQVVSITSYRNYYSIFLSSVSTFPIHSLPSNYSNTHTRTHM